jgi:hypothetical protein
MVDRGGLPAWRSVRLRIAAESDFIVRAGQVYLACPTMPNVAACTRPRNLRRYFTPSRSQCVQRNISRHTAK